MENRKNWYLISTKPGCEVKVAQAFKKMNITCYVPLQNQFANSSSNKRIGHKVLFPSFVFVFTSEQDHSRLKKVDNVFNIMYWLNKPVIIKSEEISGIQNFLKEHSNVVVEKLGINYSGKYALQTSGRNFFEIEEELEKLPLASIGYALTATSSIPQLLEVA